MWCWSIIDLMFTNFKILWLRLWNSLFTMLNRMLTGLCLQIYGFGKLSHRFIRFMNFTVIDELLELYFQYHDCNTNNLQWLYMSSYDSLIAFMLQMHSWIKGLTGRERFGRAGEDIYVCGRTFPHHGVT